MRLLHELRALHAFLLATFAHLYARAMGLFSALGSLSGLSSLPSSLGAGLGLSSSRAGAEVYEPGDRYAGMVNLSGTLCYMNSVLQAFASLPTLVAHLDRIVVLAEDVDLPTPVTDALLGLLMQLNTGHARQPAPLRPHALLAALAPLPAIRRLLATREQQDAHELFVVLAEAVSDEATKVAKEVARTRGLGQALEIGSSLSSRAGTPAPSSLPSSSLSHHHRPDSDPPSLSIPAPAIRVPFHRPETSLAQPWEGLLARRRVCRRCGYSDVVRMDTLGGMELPVPRSGEVSLDACIAEYLAPERLDGVECDMCTLRATADKYAAREAVRAGKEKEGEENGGGVDALGSGSGWAWPVADGDDDDAPTTGAAAKKKRALATRLAARLRAMVESGVPAIEPGPIKWETMRTECIRETSVTRAPRTLRFHFVRSEFTPYGHVLKKTARVAFPLMFDLGPHMARGVWEPRGGKGEGVGSMIALASAVGGDGGKWSVAGAGGQRGNTPDVSAGVQSPPRALYRLQSAILHYGYTHSSGHFVAIRRKPHSPPDLLGRGWLRISDADVDEVGADELFQARGAVFMLFYERVDLPARAYDATSGMERAGVHASTPVADPDSDLDAGPDPTQHTQWLVPPVGAVMGTSGHVAPGTGTGLAGLSGISSFSSLGLGTSHTSTPSDIATIVAESRGLLNHARETADSFEKADSFENADSLEKADSLDTPPTSSCSPPSSTAPAPTSPETGARKRAKKKKKRPSTSGGAGSRKSQ